MTAFLTSILITPISDLQLCVCGLGYGCFYEYVNPLNAGFRGCFGPEKLGKGSQKLPELVRRQMDCRGHLLCGNMATFGFEFIDQILAFFCF